MPRNIKCATNPTSSRARHVKYRSLAPARGEDHPFLFNLSDYSSNTCWRSTRWSEAAIEKREMKTTTLSRHERRRSLRYQRRNKHYGTTWRASLLSIRKRGILCPLYRDAFGAKTSVAFITTDILLLFANRWTLWMGTGCFASSDSPLSPLFSAVNISSHTWASSSPIVG